MLLRESRAGARASAAWLSARGLHVTTTGRWQVSITLGVDDRAATDPARSRFQLAIDGLEWGFVFCHAGRTSRLRVLDVPVVHEADDFDLVGEVPPLRTIGALVQRLESTYRLGFRRTSAAIRTTIPGSESKILTWVVASL